MTYFPRFAHPWALLFLVLVPWTIWAGVRIRSLSKGRKWVAVSLRTIVLLALIGALAGAELVKTSDKLAVFFLLDQSDSIPEAARSASSTRVQTTCDAFMKSNDESGLIVFGKDGSIEYKIGPAMKIDTIQSFVDGEQSNLASAVRLAMAAFPQGYMKRIVVYSDGNETQGNVIEEAKLAQAANVEINVVPVKIGGAEEVRLREINAPNHMNAGEPFQLRVVAHADQDCEATLRVFQRVGDGRRMMPPQKVTLHKGDNTFLLSQELNSPGFYEYEASIESEADTILANNEARAFTVVQGEPRVLYVEGDLKNEGNLSSALIAEGINVEITDPGLMPSSLARFQNYDAVVLSDVSSTDITSSQLGTLEAMVRDLGIGLVMVGGPRSFGAGGYLNTPVEKALPVNMDIKQRKMMPSGALVLVMHTCEIQDGNMWAREIALASLEVLSSQDYMGTLGYMWSSSMGMTGDTWIYELQPVGDKTMMRQEITRSSSAIGDMPSMQPCLQKAYNALKDAPAAVKRVVMISDGDPAPPTAGLLSNIAAAGIAVSTICIAPHSQNERNTLQWIARETGGEYYFVQNPNNLPQIFTKEAAVVKRGLLIEEPFVPVPNHDSELLRGLGGNGLPELQGYVVTSAKDSATVPLLSHQDDPILAHWRYGLGKSVAFTSDATGRWAQSWLGWEGFDRFWAQTVRWATRSSSKTSFRVNTSIKDGMGYVKIDAIDDSGRFVNFLRPRGAVTGPGPDFDRIELGMMQTGPGIYEGVFPLDKTGVYMVNLTYLNADGTQGTIPTGLALSYSQEYEYNTTNLPLLDQLASVGGGRVLSETEDPFTHNLVATAAITPIWQFLAVLAACLFPIEIFVRRVIIPLSVIYRPILDVLRKVPGLRRIVPELAPLAAPVTGVYRAASSSELERGEFPDGVIGTEIKEGTSAVPVHSSFGIVKEQTSEVKTGADVVDGKALGHSDYTQKLLAAKERALKKHKRGDDD